MAVSALAVIPNGHGSLGPKSEHGMSKRDNFWGPSTFRYKNIAAVDCSKKSRLHDFPQKPAFRHQVLNLWRKTQSVGNAQASAYQDPYGGASRRIKNIGLMTFCMT